jgi:hypothetical protein
MISALKARRDTDPTRGALAAAIEKLASLRGEVAANEDAGRAAWELLHEASAAARKAREAVDNAPALERREKAEALTKAENRVEDVRAHRQEFAAKGEDLRQRLDWAEPNLRNRIAGVVQPHAAAIVKVYKAKQQELLVLGATLNFISSKNGLAREDRNWHAQPVFTPHHPDPAWVQWIAALETHPNAPVPGD